MLLEKLYFLSLGCISCRAGGVRLLFCFDLDILGKLFLFYFFCICACLQFRFRTIFWLRKASVSLTSRRLALPFPLF
jgi:hypothetical protein